MFHLVGAILPQNRAERAISAILVLVLRPSRFRKTFGNMLGDRSRTHPRRRSVKPILTGLAVCIAVVLFVLVPVSSPVYAGTPATHKTDAEHDLAAAADYCVANGGEVETRVPTFNTNDDPQNWFRLSGSRKFCQFTAHDGSRIHVLLSTLYTTKPSLAALAYYAKVPLQEGCNGNPASCYCSQLGGTDLFGGINLNGGGWVLKGAIDEVLEACILPDLSSIDSWGLAYHQADIIRGKNLGKVLRYSNPYAVEQK